MSGAELYRAMCDYLTQNGWYRDEPGSGWWWHSQYGEEGTVGDAVEQQFDVERIDTRMEPQWHPAGCLIPSPERNE